MSIGILPPPVPPLLDEDGNDESRQVSASVLVLSPDAGLHRRIGNRLNGSFNVVHCETLSALQQHRRTSSHRAVLVHWTDRTLGRLSPPQFMSELRGVVDFAPMYALIDPECPPYFQALAEKTVDFCVSLPIDGDQLATQLAAPTGLSAELKRLHSSRPNKTLQGRTTSIVSFTPEMFRMIEDVEIASLYDITVLLMGETGCGKSHFAQLIHERSPRANERFITVACGAIPPNLIESELFGHVKGAFTGADRDKDGKFAAAAGGTLLLDEIDVLPLDQQAKLLRVIETSEYEQVGSNDTQVSQARLIVASNEELPRLVEAGLFRSDLYYRLNVVKFRLQPLRERPWDIEYLARQFALEYGRQHNIDLQESDQGFIDALLAYSWPGNIRQLKNVIHRAVLYSRDGRLSFNDVPSALDNSAADFATNLAHQHVNAPVALVNGNGHTNGHADGNGNGNGSGSPSAMNPAKTVNGAVKTLCQQMDDVERRIIEDALRRNDCSRKATSRELGISRVTLYNKMKKLHLLDGASSAAYE